MFIISVEICSADKRSKMTFKKIGLGDIEKTPGILQLISLLLASMADVILMKVDAKTLEAFCVQTSKLAQEIASQLGVNDMLMVNENSYICSGLPGRPLTLRMYADFSEIDPRGCYDDHSERLLYDDVDVMPTWLLHQVANVYATFVKDVSGIFRINQPASL
jgi:hypothetical protein